jgi:hypothetical protein
MIGFDSTQCCGWCAEAFQDAAGALVDHDPCDIALRNARLGYCAACGKDIVNGQHGPEHDACMVLLTGRADLLEPGPDESATLERLVGALEAAILDGTVEAAARANALADQARWN